MNLVEEETPSPFILKNKKMKRIFNLILIAGVTIMSYSCATSEAPTPADRLIGSWIVASVFADFQGEDQDVYSAFFLERDGSFTLVIEEREELVRGTWSATSNSITLVSAITGEQIVFDIFYQDYNKMQLDQRLALPSGELVVTYFLNYSSGTSYGNYTDGE